MQGTAISRRSFVAWALASVPVAALGKALAAPLAIRVASNQGIENAALQQLMANSGIARNLGVDLSVAESRSISAPMEVVLAGQADVCMISAFAGLLPAIERGAELRLIGAAMQRPALALFAGRAAGIARVRDLAGRRVGIGSDKGLLHVLTMALLRRRGLDPAAVRFVDCGSNSQVFAAVTKGDVDAGLSGIAALAGLGDAAIRVPDGNVWQALPQFTYQPAYASLRALRDKPEAVARCLAAYTRLYRMLAARHSRDAYLAARRQVAGEPPGGTAEREGDAVWRWVQRTRPYGTEPGIAPQRLAYLQQMNITFGLQRALLPYAAVVDPRPAITARSLLAAL